MPSSSVAEKSIRCPRGGVASRSRRTCGRKPRSAMWSASSTTVTSTASSEAWPWRIRSSSRPGHATRTSTPRRSAATWGFCPTPPNTVREVRPRTASSGAIASSIWVASSRVGARTSARGRRGDLVVPLRESRVSSGRANAIVLPEPVRPRPRTSRPARESGSVAAWIGVGVVMPASARTSTRAVGTPRVPKVVDKSGLSEAVGAAGRRRRLLGRCSAGRALGPRRVLGPDRSSRRHRHQRSAARGRTGRAG